MAAASRARGSALSVSKVPVAICLSGVAPLALAPHALGSFGGWLVYAFTVYAGIRFAITLFASPARPVRVFAWFYFYIFLGMAPLVQVSTGTWAIVSTPLSPSAVTDAALVVIVFVLAWDIAGIVVERQTATTDAGPPRLEVSTRRVLVLAAFALLVAAYEVHKIGGAGQLFTSREQRSESLATLGSASRGITTALLVYPVFVCAYTLIAVRRFRRLKSLRLVTLLLTAAALVLANPAGTSRYGVASVYGALVFAWFWPLTKNQMVTVGLAALVGLFIIFPGLNYFRTSAHTVAAIGGVPQQLTHGDYDSFEQIANTDNYVAAKGHTFGSQELSALLFFVPRSVWSGKASDTGVIVGRFTGYTFVNLSAPMPAEAFIDGGLAWVVLVGAGFGAASAWLDKKAADPSRRLTYVGLFTPVFAVYQVILLRGSLLQAMGGVAAIGGVLLLCMRRPVAAVAEATQSADSISV